MYNPHTSFVACYCQGSWDKSKSHRESDPNTVYSSTLEVIPTHWHCFKIAFKYWIASLARKQAFLCIQSTSSEKFLRQTKMEKKIKAARDWAKQEWK